MAVGMVGLSLKVFTVKRSNDEGQFNCTLKVRGPNGLERDIPCDVQFVGPVKERDLAIAFFDAYKKEFGNAIVKSREDCINHRDWVEKEVDLSQIKSQNSDESLRVMEIARKVLEFIAEPQEADCECICEGLWKVISVVAELIFALAIGFILGATAGMGVLSICAIVVAYLGPWSVPVLLVLAVLWAVGFAYICNSLDAENRQENEQQNVFVLV